MTTLNEIATQAPSVNHPSVRVTLCDPEGVHCCRCGDELLDGQTNVVIVQKPTGVEIFCGPECRRRDIRDAERRVERAAQVASGAEEDPFAEDDGADLQDPYQNREPGDPNWR